MLNFVKTHWLLLALAALFIYAVYTGSQTVAKVVTWAYCGLAAAALIMGLGWLAILWPLAGALWAAGYVWGWLPYSAYSWMAGPSAGTGQVNASATYDESGDGN